MAYQQYIPDGEPYGIGELLSDPLAIAAAVRGEIVSQFIATRFNKRTIQYPVFTEIVLDLSKSLGRSPTSSEIHAEGMRRGTWSYVSFTEAVIKPVAEFTVLAAAAVAVGAGLSYVGASIAANTTGATVGATGASVPAAASAVSVAPVTQAGAVVASASTPVAGGMGATLATAGATLSTTAANAAGAAIVASVIPAPKPSQAAPVARPSEPVSVSPLALVAGLAAVAGAFLLP